MIFTVVAMCGGNPKHDAFGFRHWITPGPFIEWYTTGAKGRFFGFMQAVFYAASAITGPDYISMSAAEVQMPRKNLPKAFRSTIYRLLIFFLLNTVTSSMACSPRDPALQKSIDNYGALAGTSSPYYVLMTNLGVKVYPQFINALYVVSGMMQKYLISLF